VAALAKRPFGLLVVVFLVVVQSVLGFLRANQWFHAGADLWGEGLVIIPLMGLVAIGRGGLIAGTALLYILFAAGALAGKSWSWWMGFVAALINGFLVLNVVLQGESVMQSMIWLIVPVILLFYLFLPNVRGFLKN
jgi:hypothetical protein